MAGHAFSRGGPCRPVGAQAAVIRPVAQRAVVAGCGAADSSRAAAHAIQRLQLAARQASRRCAGNRFGAGSSRAGGYRDLARRHDRRPPSRDSPHRAG